MDDEMNISLITIKPGEDDNENNEEKENKDKEKQGEEENNYLIELKNIKDSPIPPSFFTKFSFFYFGVSCLLGWNAILTVMDFFVYFQGDYSPAIVYPFCNNILNMGFQLFILISKGKLFDYKKQIFYSLLGSMLCVALIPIPVCCTPRNSTIGFAFTCIIILLMGLINALLSNGFYGLASIFPTENLVFLSTGQGMAGILMNIIQIIILLCSGASTNTDEDSKKVNAIIFFGISAGIILSCMILLIFVYKTPYYQYHINLANIEEKSKARQREKAYSPDIEPEIKYSFCSITKKILSLDFLAIYVCILTFALFPGIALQLPLFNLGSYYTVTINIIFNISDTLGRLSTKIIKPNKILSFAVILSRTIFLVLFPIDYAMIHNFGADYNGTSVFTIILLVIFGVSNGVGGTNILGLAPSYFPEQLKGPAGASIGFFNIVGISIGSALAFLTNYLLALI